MAWPFNQIFFSSILFRLVSQDRWELKMPLAAKIRVKSSTSLWYYFFVGCSYIFRFIMEKVRSNKVSSKEGDIMQNNLALVVVCALVHQHR